MNDEMVEAAFLAGVSRWTYELARLNRNKKYKEAELLAWRLADGYLKVAQLLQAKQEG